MTVVPFRRPDGSDVETLAFTAEVYTTPGGNVRLVAHRPDDGPIDAEAMASLLVKLTNAAHAQLGDRALASIFIMTSSRTRTLWNKNAFETPAQYAWLRRRLAQVYWNIDGRRGLRYFLYATTLVFGRFYRFLTALNQRM